MVAQDNEAMIVFRLGLLSDFANRNIAGMIVAFAVSVPRMRYVACMLDVATAIANFLALGNVVRTQSS